MKSIKIVTLFLAFLFTYQARAQYCASTATNTVDDDIGNVTFGALNNGIGTPALNNPTSVNTYTDFTALPPVVFLQGLNYPISVTQINSSASFYSCYLTVYIDYNQDSVFDVNTELVFDGQTDAILGGNTLSGSVTIPLSSLPGVTRMRVLLQENGSITQPSCGTYTYGETEDYNVVIQAATPCVAPPTAGTAVASVTNVCPSINFNLNLTGSSIASGLIYQWQSSPTISGFTNVGGANSISFVTSQTSSTYYRCVISCNGVADTSSAVLVSINSFATCYCTSSATSTADDDIGSISFGPLSNGVGTPATSNPTSINTYSDFTNLPVQTYLQGLNYPINITQINLNGFYECQIYVYIDYDQNGIYDPATETAFNGTTTAGTGGNIVSGNVTIPLTSTAGNTGMRVVLVEGTFNTVAPCGTYTWGETEDYIVNIMMASPCTTPPSAGFAYSNDSTVCPSINYQLNLSGSSIASGLSYQWQSSANGVAWANVSGATTINFQTSQTSDTYYHCIISCQGVTDTSSVVFISTNSFTTCYCQSAATNNLDSDIGNVSFGSLNNGSATPATNNPASNGLYTDFTSLTPAILLQGLNYPISVSQINQAGFQASLVNVYVDFDQNGIYDPFNEVALTGQSINGVGGNVVSSSFTIPLTALTGNTGMRVVLVEGTFSTVQPCGTYFNGETEDYIVNIQTPLPCVTPPAAGTTTASATTVCPNIPFDLNVTGSANAAGLTYQWQESSNGSVWTNISGATTINFQTTLTVNTYYQCLVICAGVSSASIPILVNVNSFFNCYCTSNATSTGDDDIGNVTFGLLDNGIASPSTQNSSSVNTYTDFTNLPPFTYIQTLTYPVSVTQINLNGFYVCSGAVYIDFDHDGNFDPATETVLTGTTSTGQTTISGTFTIPISTFFGLTRMRVVLKEGANPAAQPCGTYNWGETEDYLVNILLPNSCSIPFIGGLVKSSVSQVCAADVFTLSLDSLPPDTGFTFQWQRSYDNLNWTNIAGATIQVYKGSQSFDTWYRCNVTCNGGTTVSAIATQIINNVVTQCDYCNETLSGNCSTDYFLDSVAIGGTTFNNSNTGCAAISGFAYSKYPISGNTTTDIARGNYYDMFVKTAGSCNISVWIDYDQSGTFDSNEWIQVSQATDSATTATIPMVIPSTPKLGATGMRIRSRKAGTLNLAADACNTYGSGETEDYYVTIVDAISTGKELNKDSNLKIYPNPTTGIVNVEFRSNESNTISVRIMNPEGQVIYVDAADKFKGVYSHKVDLSAYSKGIYFVQFVTDREVMTRKIILN